MKFTEKDIDEFISTSKDKPYSDILEKQFKTAHNSLMHQYGWNESEYLEYTIRDCVLSYSRDKDKLISMFKDFVDYLAGKGIRAKVTFPPIRIYNDFERLMFIAKYMQDEGHTRDQLRDILWVSKNTIDSDLSRLTNENNPEVMQVLGKPFVISGASSRSGRVEFESTAHPLFLTPNLTQVILILEGLKEKSENPIYETEAKRTAADIWNQLSDYARRRIIFVLSESLMISDVEWYLSLEKYGSDNSFHTERKHPRNRGFVFDCVKNQQKPFCIEYNDNGNTVIYKDCQGKKILEGEDIIISSGGSQYRLHIPDILRIAYTVEELLSEDSMFVETQA